MSNVRIISCTAFAVVLLFLSTARDATCQNADDNIRQLLKCLRYEKQFDALPDQAKSLTKKALWYSLNWPNNLEYLTKCTELSEQILKAGFQNELAYRNLIYSWYWLGVFEKDKSNKVKAWKKGLEYSRQGIKFNQNDFWSHYFLFSCRAEIANNMGRWNQMSALGELSREVDFMVDHQPDRPESWMLKGTFMANLPGILGGSMEEGIKSLEKAITLNANFTRTYLELAKACIKAKEYTKAKKTLNDLLSIKSAFYPSDHAKYEIPEGKKLLREIEKLEP
jgi:hypothetical protein